MARKLFGLLAALAISGCAATSVTENARVASPDRSASMDQVETKIDGTGFLRGYRLGSADRVRIIVYGEQQLTGEFAVNEQGQIIFPLIGEVVAEGQTIGQVAENIKTKLASGFINEPDVAAEVVKFRPYYILGEVTRPGEYNYSVGITVMKAVAAAEGFTYRANKSVAYIKRFEGGQEIKVRLTPETVVYPGDVVRISQRFF